MKMKKILCKRFDFCSSRLPGRWFLAFIFLAASVFGSGCPMIAVLGNPTSYEQKVKAEYNISPPKDPLEAKKILVLVDQPMRLNSQVNLRFYLTRAINILVTAKAKIESENVISYDKLSEFRSNTESFSQLTPSQVGRELGADMVLVVVVSGYKLTQIAQSGYYEGNLTVKAGLFDVANEVKLWPVEDAAKTVKVGFEMGSSDRQAAVKRLAVSASHCTVRYLYDCPKAMFKISDDKSPSEWDSWDMN